MIIPEIKRVIKEALDANLELKDTKAIFLISCQKPELGEMSHIVRYVEDNIDGFKAQALLFSIGCITKDIWKENTKCLRKD